MKTVEARLLELTIEGDYEGVIQTLNKPESEGGFFLSELCGLQRALKVLCEYVSDEIVEREYHEREKEGSH